VCRLSILRPFAVAAAAGILAAACGPAGGGQQGLASNQTLRFNITTEPNSFDPGQEQYTYEAAVSRQAFEALVKPKPDLSDVQAATAESWSVSSDGLTWTFKIRKNAKWSDGQPVKAQDFVYGWQRILDPRLSAPYADPFFTEVVKGAGEYGKLDPKKDADKIPAFIQGLGLKAQDDNTFVVQLQQPAPFFKWIASLFMAVPVRKDIVEKYGSDKWATKPEQIISNGPYKISEIAAKDHVTLVPNEFYWGGKPTITKIVESEISDDNAEFAKYQNGEEDIGRVPLANTDLVRNDPKLSKELLQIPELSMFWIQFNNTKAPFNDVNMRLAVTQAVDRDSLVKDVLKGRAVASTTFIPKGQTGYKPELGDIQKFDPVKAKATLAKVPNKPSEIKFLIRNLTASKQIGEFVADQIQKNLGISVKQEVIDSKTVTSRLRKKDFEMYIGGWLGDYPDNQDWFDIFKCGSGNQFSGYCSKQYDDLVKKADGELDAKKRQDLYDQAHKLLIDEMAGGFLYQRTAFWLKKPYVQGLTTTPIDEWPGTYFPTKISIAAH